jgi:hypothetical protein
MGNPVHPEGSLSGTGLGRSPVHISVLVAEFKEELILGLDTMHTYDELVDVERHMLRLGQEEISLSTPGHCPSLRVL